MNSNHAYLLLSIIVLSLFGCSKNYTNVRTFADATTSVTQATPALLTDNQQSCWRSQRLTQQMLTVIKSDFEAKYSADYKAICESRGKKLKPIADINTVLSNFSGAISSLAKDDFVTGKPEAENATNFLTSMGKLGAFELTSDQISAVTKISQFVTNAMLNSERQSSLSKAFSQENQKNLKEIISALQKASGFFLLDLVSETETICLISTEMARNRGNEEVLALSEFKDRLASQIEIIEAKKIAITKYSEALLKLSEAIAPAAKSIQNPGNKEILTEIKNFAQQAYDLNKLFKTEFGR